jgi:hypothetical protein
LLKQLQDLTYDLKLSWQTKALKFSREVSRVNVKLKTDVSEVSSVSTIRLGMMNDRILLILVPVFQIALLLRNTPIERGIDLTNISDIRSFTTSALMMETETLVFSSTLTRLITREKFSELKDLFSRKIIHYYRE